MICNDYQLPIFDKVAFGAGDGPPLAAKNTLFDWSVLTNWNCGST